VLLVPLRLPVLDPTLPLLLAVLPPVLVVLALLRLGVLAFPG
jgi:hypothetical protein